MEAILEELDCVRYGLPASLIYLCSKSYSGLSHTTKSFSYLSNKMYIKNRRENEQRESISAYPWIYEKVNVQIDVGCQV